MAKIEMCAPCLFGLEGVLADELRNIEAENVRPENGRVLFSGDSRILARANLWLRTAERVEIVVGSFKAYSFEELFEGTKKLEWERWIDKRDAFPVKGWSLNSKLYSIPDCQSIIKKAVVKKLSEKYNIEWNLKQEEYHITKGGNDVVVEFRPQAVEGTLTKTQVLV